MFALCLRLCCVVVNIVNIGYHGSLRHVALLHFCWTMGHGYVYCRFLGNAALVPVNVLVCLLTFLSQHRGLSHRKYLTFYG